MRPDPARGIFETLLVAGGRPVELDAHLARLDAGARELFGAGSAARVAGPAHAVALQRAAGLALGRLRLTLASGSGGSLEISATTAPIDAEIPFPSPERGAALASVVVPGGLGRLKWADRRLLEAAAAARTDGAQPLILDTGDAVLEAERANVFAVLDGELLTPPDDGRLLPGISRARAIEIARDLGIPVRERGLTVDDLRRAGEAFLTGSVRGVEPVRAIDGAEIPRRGEITARVSAVLRARWLGDTAAG